MALSKHKDDNFGNGGYEYWRVIETNINWQNKSSHVVIAGYINKKARTDNKQPIECVAFDWSGTEFPFELDVLNEENENTVAIAYKKIKESVVNDKKEETNWFADAIDC